MLLQKTFVCLINTLKLFCHYQGLGLSYTSDNPSLWVICKNKKKGLRDGVASPPSKLLASKIIKKNVLSNAVKNVLG